MLSVGAIMPTANARLCELLELAEHGSQGAALAGGLADLLLDGTCPAALRPPMMALLEKALRDTDDATRALLAARLGGHGELPLDLVNEFYLYAPARVRREILMRNELAGDADEVADPPDAARLVADARAPGDFAERLGEALAIEPRTAGTILCDSSGEALAVLCKGAHLNRATFSALALLKGAPADDPAARLCVFENVPEHAAERLTRYWRAHYAPAHQQIAAAE